MCGILAVLSRARPIARDYTQLLDSIRHRGPDDRGAAMVSLACDNTEPAQRAWLGHTRLSILDLSPRGHQPMTSADGNLVMVFNGEIYNYIELRDQLRALGARFTSDSDTEVLLEAWSHWGADALRRLKGMFAFLVVDRRAGTATLARDHFGIKPLYYAEEQGTIAVCSEVLPLLESGHGTAALSADIAFEYLRFGATRAVNRTLLRDVQSVPAGHVIEFDFREGTLSDPREYWRLRSAERSVAFVDAVKECRERFVENVRLHLRSDVPVGAALSGGIDSASIVCVMRSIEPDLNLQTFSYIPENAAHSEERWVDLVHQTVGGVCHKIRPTPHALADDLDVLVRRQGEPFASASIYAQYCVFKRAREEGVPVTLDGQGADELLAGYWPHVGTYAGELLRSGRVTDALSQVLHAAPGVGGRARTAAMLAQAILPAGLRRAARRAAGKGVVPPYLDRDWFAAQHVDCDAVADALIGQHRSLKGHLIDTVDHGSLPILLRYADRNSMTLSVESRVPFLTHDFAEFVMALPPSYLVARDGTRKHVFREAMKGILPEAIRVRRDKIGFFADDALWLRENRGRFDSVVAELASMPLFHGRKLHAFVDGFWNRRHENAPLVWRALMFGLWHREVSQTLARRPA